MRAVRFPPPPISIRRTASAPATSSSIWLKSSNVAEFAERFFSDRNARVEIVPVMAADNLQKGLSGLEKTIRGYG